MQPEGVHEEVVGGLSKDFPWADMLTDLSTLIESKEYYDQTLVKKAGTRVVRIWGDTTTLEQRKAALKKLQENIDHKEVYMFPCYIVTTEVEWDMYFQ